MKIKCFAASFLLALIFAGCQNTVNTVENSDKTMQPNVIRDSRFVTDGFLKDRLALRNVVVDRTQDGYLRAQLTATNVRVGVLSQMWSGMTGENPYKIRYKFTWFNKGGMAVETVLSDWQTAVITPGESVHFQSIAPSKECNDFRIDLQEAN